MDTIEQAKQIANESDQLVASLEAAQAGTNEGTPTNYSGSTNSCTVDADGVITLTTILYPGDTPIVPPGEGAPEAPVEVPSDAVPPTTDGPPDEQVPPAQVPAQ